MFEVGCLKRITRIRLPETHCPRRIAETDCRTHRRIQTQIHTSIYINTCTETHDYIILHIYPYKYIILRIITYNDIRIYTHAQTHARNEEQCEICTSIKYIFYHRACVFRLGLIRLKPFVAELSYVGV